MKKVMFILGMLILVMTSSLVVAQVEPTELGWEHKRELIISPATPVDDFQVKIELNLTNFDYSKANVNGDDIRFYDADGNKLSYWISSWNESGTSIVWVGVKREGTGMIYIYYGNPLTMSESSGDDVFDFFDDFNDGVWTDKWENPHSQGTYTEENGMMKLYSTGYCSLDSIKHFVGPVVMETRVKRFTGADYITYLREVNDNNKVWAGITNYGNYYGMARGGSDFGNQALFLDSSNNEWQEYRTLLHDDVWHVYRGDSLDDWKRNDSLLLDASANNREYYVQIFTHEWRDSGAYWDWVIIRKYSELEPTVVVGDEVVLDENCEVWRDTFDNNSNGWSFVNGAGISGGVLDASAGYSRGYNDLVFLNDSNIDKIVIKYDAYRSSSGSAISSVLFSHFDNKVQANWNYYSPHNINGFSYFNASGRTTAVPYPHEYGWRKVEVVLENLTTSPVGSYYFENEGVMKTVAEKKGLYYNHGYPDLPQSIAIRMGNGFTGPIKFDNLNIEYCMKDLVCTDEDGDGHFAEGGECGEVDCDDLNDEVHPGASDEVCDGIDNDCDGNVDEDYVSVPTSCGVGECSAVGELICEGGVVIDSCIGGVPTEEVCDGLDNDCDGEVDGVDADLDGVDDCEEDLCLGTVVPEENVPLKKLGKHRYALVDDDLVFDTGKCKKKGHWKGWWGKWRKHDKKCWEHKRNYTVEDTHGCSCEQIIEKLGLGKGHIKYGCSISAMNCAASGFVGC